MRVLVTTLLLSIAALADAKLLAASPKLSIVSDKGSILRADSLKLAQSETELEKITLGPTDTLKLSFTVTDDAEEGTAGVQPHQAFLRFYEVAGEEGIQPVKINTSGKGKFELNVRRPPASIPPTLENAALNVDLILGSFTRESSVVPLFKLVLPASLPVPPHAEEKLYHPQRAIYHKFKPEQKTPNKTISAIFAAIALSPWVLLAGLLSQLPIHVKPTASTAPFLVLLAAFEGLIVWYWVDLRLGQVLSYGAVLAVVTGAAGKRALSSL